MLSEKKSILLLGIVSLICSALFAQTDSGGFKARPPIHILPKPVGIQPSSSPLGLSPSQVRAAYGLPSTGGSGTIAIIDAFDDPNIQKDFNTFSLQYGLPTATATNFEIHKMASTIQSATANPFDSWDGEECLDTQWSHAIAPNAKILFVECTSDDDDLFAGVAYAASRSDVVAISCSWGGSEFPNESTYDSYFVSSYGATFFVSSGDDGAGVYYPASSKNVIGVGGTNLYFNSLGQVTTEVAWNGSSGGMSRYETEPTFQTSFGVPSTKGYRAVPDVSYNGGAASPVAIYDSYAEGWNEAWGTSAGSPQWAAIRTLNPSITDTFLYNLASNPVLYAIDFRDIVSGSNTVHPPATYYTRATVGYDYVTGLGSPLSANFYSSITVPVINNPVVTNIPSVKMFLSNASSSNPEFDLSNFNTGGTATTYSIISNFLGLSTLSGSSVAESTYVSATTGVNQYFVANSYGVLTATNKVKYSTYKIWKLPKVGLTPGSSWDVNVASYTYDTTGNDLPPSFGNASSLILSNPSNVTAYWTTSSVVHIVAMPSFIGSAEVDVIASPVAVPPYGSDIDEERISVYANLLANGTFSTSNDTAAYGLEIAPGRTTLATQSWISTYVDSAGTIANGVWQISFPDGSAGFKATPFASNFVTMSSTQWYTARVRVAADSPNSHTAVLFGYSNYVGSGIQADIAANIYFGIPTTWTWIETPFLVHGNSTAGYLQVQFKAATTGNVYIDELQIINAPPTLVDANRGNTRVFYSGGDFTNSNSTTLWGQQVYFGAGSSPIVGLGSGYLQFTFANAGSGSNQVGTKWTADNGTPGTVATPQVNVGRQVGTRLSFFTQSGSFNSLGIVLVAAYGVQSSGQYDFGAPYSNLIAAAEVGVLVNGTVRAIGTAVNPYYQFQFGVRSDQSGLLLLNNIDLDYDNDDPNFGDSTLFP